MTKVTVKMKMSSEVHCDRIEENKRLKNLEIRLSKKCKHFHFLRNLVYVLLFVDVDIRKICLNFLIF